MLDVIGAADSKQMRQHLLFNSLPRLHPLASQHVWAVTGLFLFMVAMICSHCWMQASQGHCPNEQSNQGGADQNTADESKPGTAY